MWFRKDLRLADNEALHAAVSTAEQVGFVAVAPRAPATASERWREASLRSLAEHLPGAIAIVAGPAEEAIPRLAHELDGRSVHCSRDYTPAGLAEERRVAERLQRDGRSLTAHGGQLLVPPGELSAASGGAFRVFTPFFRAWLRALDGVPPLDGPTRVNGVDAVLESSYERAPVPLGLEPPTEDAEAWEPGERSARKRLARFAEGSLARYDETRDRPGEDGTSELSPRLAHGELSPRQVVHAAFAKQDRDVALPFVRQVAWREFAYHVLAEFPELAERPWRPEFSAMPWRDDPAGFSAWEAGSTGFPMVDAGMRQLARSGWMHNRVRLLAASFLTKDLLLPWPMGEVVFERLLADYDPALNAFNWQWVAGSGADASPYFRVFNPVTQGTKFDSDGAYVSRWVPELSYLPPHWIHHPWEAPERELRMGRVSLGRDYPKPIVDHATARRQALAAFDEVRASRKRSGSASE